MQITKKTHSSAIVNPTNQNQTITSSIAQSPTSQKSGFVNPAPIPLQNRNIQNATDSAPDYNKLLCEACKCGDENMFNLCLENNADVNHFEQGCSVLEFAINNERSEMTKTLLERGADPEPSQNSIKMSPLWYAAGRNDIIMAKVLVPYCSRLAEALSIATLQASPEMVMVLLTHLERDPSVFDIGSKLIKNAESRASCGNDIVQILSNHGIK